MNDIKIKKISTDMINYVEIDGNFNIALKKMDFELSAKDYNILFPTDPRITVSNIDFYTIDENDKEYSCIGCVAGLYFGQSIKIKVVSINLIFENLIHTNENLKINYIEFETSYPKHYKYGCYIKDFKIKYTKDKTIYIRKEYTDELLKINISIDSKIETKREKLDNLLYSLLEIIYLLFGCIPKLEKYTFKYNNKVIITHFNLVDKYFQNTKSGSNDDCLSIIDETILTKDLIKKFIKFRKETLILYDMFMINQNGMNYVEITNSMLVQLIEGTYKTLTKTKKELWEILDFYFKQNPTTNMLLNKKDLRSAKDNFNTPIFLYKVKEHRNYLSHLNMNEQKKVFNGLENNYAKFKLVLCLRLIYMEYLGIAPDNQMLNNIIKSIDNWGIKHNIKI